MFPSFQVQSYDPDSNSWLLRATIPTAKRCITAVSLNNLIYVAGGLTKAIYCYDPVEDYWMHVQNTFSRQVINKNPYLYNAAALPILLSCKMSAAE